ncbi:MAG: hypothetical protein WC197_03185 [Candidatus Gastranaerophilaceae bacterium]|jgi:hypothetical protein
MNEEVKKDKLSIDYDGEKLDFDVDFGYIDRVYSEFNFSSGKKEIIEGYNISVNPENLDGKVLKELEEISENLNKFFNISLNLDGLIHKGKAKIARKFGIGGFNLDVEIHS